MSIQPSPKVWAEVRIEWPYPEGACYRQPPNNQPRILFSACCTSWDNDALKDILPPARPAGYVVSLWMNSVHRAMPAKTLLKQRTTRINNQIKKRAAGMPEFMQSYIRNQIMSKRPDDYLTLKTCQEQYAFKTGILKEIDDEHARDIVTSITRLDAFPALKQQMKE